VVVVVVYNAGAGCPVEHDLFGRMVTAVSSKFNPALHITLLQYRRMQVTGLYNGKSLSCPSSLSLSLSILYLGLT